MDFRLRGNDGEISADKTKVICKRPFRRSLQRTGARIHQEGEGGALVELAVDADYAVMQFENTFDD